VITDTSSTPPPADWRRLCRAMGRGYDRAMLCRERLNSVPFWPIVGSAISFAGFVTMITGLVEIDSVLEGIAPSWQLVQFCAPALTAVAVAQILQVAHSIYCKCTMHSGCCMNAGNDTCYTGPCSSLVNCCGEIIVYLYQLGLAGFGWLVVFGFIVVTVFCAIIAGIFLLLIVFCEVPMPFGSNLALAIGQLIHIAVVFNPKGNDGKLSAIGDRNITQAIANVCDKSDTVLQGAILLVLGDSLVLAGKIIVLCTYVTIWEVYLMYRGKTNQIAPTGSSTATVEMTKNKL